MPHVGDQSTPQGHADIVLPYLWAVTSDVVLGLVVYPSIPSVSQGVHGASDILIGIGYPWMQRVILRTSLLNLFSILY
jgi:hypothetical protein